MTMRGTTEQYAGGAPLVDKMIGEGYPTVRLVAENMEYFRHVSAFLKEVVAVSGSLPAIGEIGTRIEQIDILIDNIDKILAVAAANSDINTVVTLIPILSRISENFLALLNLNDNLPIITNIDANFDVLKNIDDNTAQLLVITSNMTKLNDIYNNMALLLSSNAVKRENHTGVQSIDTIQGLREALEGIDESGAPAIGRIAARIIMPEDYGAVGNDPTFDDTAGLQDAFNACASQPGGHGVVSLNPQKTYYCQGKLKIDPSRTLIEGNGAKISFSQKEFSDPAAAPIINTNPSFDDGNTGWTVTAATTRQPVFANGEVRHDAVQGVNTYCEFGQQIIAPAGSKLRMRIEIGYINSITVGSNTFRDLLITLRSGSLAAGSSAGVAKSISNRDGNYKPGQVVEWDVFTTVANPYIRLQSNASFSVKRWDVQVNPDNTCILIQTPANGRLRGHNERSINNLKIEGKPNHVQSGFVDIFEFETPTAGLSSRTNFYNVDASDGVGRALLFGNRAYLMNFHSCRFTASRACVETLESPQDAGENIAFFGGNLGAGQCGIRNRGMAIRAFGMSIDFSRQFYVGSGNFEAHGCWFETYQHTAADTALATFAETQYRFDIHSGNMKLYGGYIQIHTGEGLAEAIFRTGRNSTIDLVQVDVFNLTTTSGAMAVGEGRISSRIRGGVGKSTEAIMSRSILNNFVIGDMEDSIPVLNTWLTSNTKQKQNGRHSLGWYTNRDFVGTTARASTIINVANTTGLNLGQLVTGPMIPAGAVIKTITANTSIEITMPAMYTAADTPLNASNITPYATASLTQEDGIGRTGAKAMRIYKTGIGSTHLVHVLAIPVEKNVSIGGEIYLKVPPGLSGNQTIYFDATFDNIQSTDADGLPKRSNRRFSITSQNIAVDLAAGLDWTRLSWKSTRVDPSSDHDGYSPDWASHVCLAFNLAAMPNGFQMFLDDLVASQF